MSRYWSETVRRLTPYVPGEQRQGPDIVKLNTNENPYPPSPRVLEAIAAVDGDSLRRYPDPESEALCQALAEYHGVRREQVHVGNGSDEILALSFQAYFTKGTALQFPEVSYSFYPVYCDLYDIQARPIPLNDDFSLHLEAFEPNSGGIVFPNPNAPTGRAVPLSAICALLEKHTDEVLLIDEAYADFGADSAIGLIDKYPNLLVSQTFSKGRSLAGMRLGAVFGNEELIDGIKRVKNSFNSYPVDALAQRAGIASLADEAGYRQSLRQLVSTRDALASALRERSFDVLPSAANFLFVSPPGKDAHGLFLALGEAGVLVRYWNSSPIEHWLRISVGTDKDSQRLLSVIDGTLA